MNSIQLLATLQAFDDINYCCNINVTDIPSHWFSYMCTSVLFLIQACLQVSPSCRPKTKWCEWILKEYWKKAPDIFQITLQIDYNPQRPLPYALYLNVKCNRDISCIVTMQISICTQKRNSVIMKILQPTTEIRLSFEATKVDLFQSFILNMQQRPCTLPSELLNHMYLHTSVYCVKQPAENACVPIEAKNESGNSELVIHTEVKAYSAQEMHDIEIEQAIHEAFAFSACIPIQAKNKAGHSQLVLCTEVKHNQAQEIHEIETGEAIQEEAFRLSAEEYPNQSARFCNNTCEKAIEIAVNTFKSPTTLLVCDNDQLKIWIAAKLDDEVKKMSFNVPLDIKFCKRYLFADQCGLWKFENNMNRYYLQELPFSTLYKSIIEPIIQHFNLLGVSKLDECIILPHDDIRSVPYHALLDSCSEIVFGEKCNLMIIPLVSLPHEINAKKVYNKVVEVQGEENNFLIVGNPTIPSGNLLSFAEKEAKFVANHIGTNPVLGELATKQIVLNLIKSAKIIHFAMHGPATHGPGFLAFSCKLDRYTADQRWKLYPDEIKKLRIQAILVVLSCCGSKKCQKDMVDAFRSAGACCVVSSLWKVDDKSIYIFMQFFYQLLINGLPSSQAFQRATQFVRCLLEYNYFLNWGGLQHNGVSIQLKKKNNFYFPIQKLLGEASVFHRCIVDDIEDHVLKTATDHSEIQVCLYHKCCI